MQRQFLPCPVHPALHGLPDPALGSTMPSAPFLPARRPASAVFAAAAPWKLDDDEPEQAVGPGAFSLIDIGEDPVPVAEREGLALCLEVLDASSPIRFKARLDFGVLRSPSTLEAGSLWRQPFRPRSRALSEVTLVLGALGPFACHYSIEDGSGVVLFRRRVERPDESIVPCCFFVLA